jgi:hypothetical protein
VALLTMWNHRRNGMANDSQARRSLGALRIEWA